jgi:hypothetical protein
MGDDCYCQPAWSRHEEHEWNEVLRVGGLGLCCIGCSDIFGLDSGWRFDHRELLECCEILRF